MKTARWFLFLWGCVAASVMCYFAFAWLRNSSTLGSNELLEGYAIGLLYGLPSWVGSPVLTYFNYKNSSIKQNTFFLLPLIVAGAVFGIIQYMVVLLFVASHSS